MSLSRSKKFIIEIFAQSPKVLAAILVAISGISQYADFFWLLLLSKSIDSATDFSTVPSGLGLSILFLMISIFGPNLFMHLDAYFQPLVFRISFEKLTLDSLRSSSKLLNGYPGTQASSEIRLASTATKSILNFFTFDLVRTPIAVIFSTAFVYSINIPLSILILSWSVLFLLISIRSVKRNSESSRALATGISRTNKTVADSLNHHKLFRISDFIESEIKYLSDLVWSESDFLKNLRVRLANAGLMLLSQRFVLTAGTAVYGIWLISQSRLSIPQFLVLLQYNNILIQSISNFSIRILEIGNELNVLERSLESLEKINCGEYQNKRMHVDNGKAVDDLIKLIKKPGRYVMTGQSGVGKTTILESLYERLISESDRSYIAYVPRESLTLDRDISENLFGSAKPEATENAVFPESSSLLARRNQMARSLSAGEQQRLNIIRLISGTPKVILLDEAVSSVDEAGAALFYQSLFAMFPKASILAVSHRQREVMMFDTQVKLTRNKSTLEIDVVDLQRRSET